MDVVTDPLVRLARLALETQICRGTSLQVLPEGLPAALHAPGACFVSLHDAEGELRGCLGTLEPTEPSLAWEIVRNAGAAGTRDHRFPPVSARELAGLAIKVDVLSPAEPVPGPEALDPHRFGVIVTDGNGRRGVLLPDLEGVDDVAHQVDIARRKAGIPVGVPLHFARFTVVRHR